MLRSAGGRYMPLAVGSAAAAAANPLSYGGPLSGSRRLQQAFAVECIGTLKGPVSHCCFLPQQCRSSKSSSSSSSSSSTKAAAAAEEESDADQEEEHNADDEGAERQEESKALEAALSSSSKQQQQQQQQRISSNCLLAEGTRVFLGSCTDTADPQKFFSAKSPVTALAARSDGALCSVAEESGQLTVLTVEGRRPLRRFHQGGSSALRTCCFGGSKQSIFAAGDDCGLLKVEGLRFGFSRVVREWSLETGVVSAELEGHKDSVRSLCCLSSVSSLVASASYDSSAKLWDTRTRKACLTLPQGDPTECVRLIEGAATLRVVTAAGPQVRLWDVRQPREAACSLQNFAKTVTVVREFPAAAAAAAAVGDAAAAAAGEGSDGLLLAAASLDNVVRIFSLDTLQLMQCFRVRSDLLCMDVAFGSSKSSSRSNINSSSSKRSSSSSSSKRSNCCRLIVGLSDGGWILRQAEAASPANEELLLLQQQQQQQQQRKRLLLLRPTDGGYFKRGRTAPSNPGDVVRDSRQGLAEEALPAASTAGAAPFRAALLLLLLLLEIPLDPAVGRDSAAAAVLLPDLLLLLLLLLVPRFALPLAGSVAAFTAACPAAVLLLFCCWSRGLVVAADCLQTKRLSRLDKLIKSFQYQAALDVALATTPQHVIALTSELLQRGGLHAAVRGRDPSSLLPLLRFAAENSAFRAPSETAVVLQLLLALLQESESWVLENPQEADEAKALLKKIAQRVAFELEQIHRLARIEAMVDALLAV
ncbi:hypothetical protein Emed_000664 [Eimeria media]